MAIVKPRRVGCNTVRQRENECRPSEFVAWRSFALRGSLIFNLLPTPYGVGFILAPLRGSASTDLRQRPC